MLASVSMSTILKIITALQIPNMIKEILKNWIKSKPEPKDPLKVIATIIAMVGSAISLVAGAKKLWPKREDIKPSRIYTPGEAAKMLQVDQDQVIDACIAGILRASKIADEYRIQGKALIEFLEIVENEG